MLINGIQVQLYSSDKIHAIIQEARKTSSHLAVLHIVHIST